MSSWNTSCSESELSGGNQTDPATYQPSAAVIILQASVMIFTIITDIIGNILVILSVLLNKKLHTPGNIFVISLSVADLIVAVYPYPLITIAILQKKWTLGYGQCKVSSTIMALGLSGSVYNILAIAINRYLCICHSSKYDKLYSMKNTYCYVFLTWILIVILLLPVTSTDAIQYDSRVYSCIFSLNTNLSLNLALASFQFIIPVSIVIFCYMRIWVLVIQAKYRVRRDNKQNLKLNELRNFLTMFVVFVLFAICWGPFGIIGLTVGFSPRGKAPKVADWLIVLSYFMAYFNSCLNGIIYGVFNRNFRNEYKRIVLSLCTCMLRQPQKLT
ncbi:melatonin receptor type 1C-like [Protopterus annectens]|uniref:melatonin receptor type 1C-like n=1 Tax=Protopterus annectens TaxID=7888 RepID=UPI001CF946C8|nr:melatonin receptor type 1C-like [Protopterus annectens]